MKVVQRAAGGANMSVDISIGTGVIYGDDQADQGAYLMTCTVLENLVISAAPGSNSRRDLIYWRINDPNAGGPAGSNSAFGKVDGTPAASPTLPALPTSAIPLAEVLVTAGNVTVVNSMITTLRVPAYGSGVLPPGVPFPFFGPESAIPADCVLYNGQAISRDTYWRIFYFLGTVHGTGDGSSTFNVPDMRGRAPFGLDNMGGSDAAVLSVANTLGLKFGAETVTLDATMIPAHTHVQDAHNHGSTGLQSADHSHSGTSSTESATHTHSGTTGNENAQHVHTANPAGWSFVIQINGGPHALDINAGTGVTVSTNQNTTVEVDSHTHNFSTGGQSTNHTHTLTTGGVSANHSHTVPSATATNQNTGGGLAHNNMPPAILCNWIARN